MANRVKTEPLSADSLNQLRRDFEQRIQEIQEDIAEGAKGSAEETLSRLRNEFDRRFSYLRKQIDESIEPGRGAIRERPMVSVGVAVASGLAVGTFIGILLSRATKN